MRLVIIIAIIAIVHAIVVYFMIQHVWTLPKYNPNTRSIVALGDSLTFGMWLLNRRRYSYPAQLQRMLKQTSVYNLGVNARTMSPRDTNAYVKHPYFQDMANYKPEIVILQFGSNDSKEHCWKGVDRFIQDYDAFIDNVKDRFPMTHIIIMGPPPIFKAWGRKHYFYTMSNDVIKQQNEALKDYAKEQGITFISLYDILEHQQQFYWFDGVHPTRGAYKIVASTLQPVIASLLSSN